jgi:hypothetical protein
MADIKLKKEDIINHIIIQAQKEFSEKEQRYIHITRLNKLITLIIKDLKEEGYHVDDFIWGYYRHGFYSKTANTFLKENYGEEFNLNTITTTNTELPLEVTNLVLDSLNGFKNFFIKNREDFYDWVYQKKTPKKYLNFYQTHRKLEKWFENMKMDFKNNDSIDSDELSDIISNYYYSLDHVEDLVTFEIFGKFTDILEQLSLKLKKGKDTSRIRIELDRLHVLYNSKIYNILTPYLDTLEGDTDEVARERELHQERMRKSKLSLQREMRTLYHDMDNENLFLTIEELQDEILKAGNKLPENSKSIQELYLDIEF